MFGVPFPVDLRVGPRPFLRGTRCSSLHPSQPNDSKVPCSLNRSTRIRLWFCSLP